MSQGWVLAVALVAIPTATAAQGSGYVPLPPGTQCVVVNTTNSGNINLTCNTARVHENGIMQGGYEVGQATGFQMGSDGVTAFFASIGDSGGGDFHPEGDFQFRGATFGSCRAGVTSSFSGMGRANSQALGQVTCLLKAGHPH